MSSYWAHCWYYKGLDAPRSKEPPAAAAVAVPGFAGGTVTDEAGVLEDCLDAAMDNGPVQDSVPAPTGEGSRDAVGVDVDAGAGVDVGRGGVPQV
jgi:hypothetical protein